MKSENTMVSEVTLKVGAICIGNGGGQSGVKLHENGVETILINSSARDLDNTIVPAGIRSFIIEDANDLGRGAGRNREIAKKLFSDWSQNKKLLANEYFVNFVSEKDIIFIVSSTAGGTGSGISPTLAYMLAKKYPNKVFILVPIMPRLTESINSQQNTIQYFNEVDTINNSGVNIPYMPFDLEKLAAQDIQTAYEKIAKDISNAVKVIRGDMTIQTPYGMIDERNMLTIATCPGMISVYVDDAVKMSDIQSDGIQSVIIRGMQKSSACAMQKDKISKYMGLFLEVDDAIEDPVKKADYTSLFNTTGEPFEIFVNYGITDKPMGKYGLVVSGQSMPYDRLKQCIDRVSEFEESQRQKEYSIADSASMFSHYAQNQNVDKILGSATVKSVESEPDVEVPDFLKSSL